jgi:hypothetical protein
MLERLGQSNEIDPEVSSVWVEEAEMRDSFTCAKDIAQWTRMNSLEFLSNKYFSEFVHPCNEKRHISSADRARTA